MVIGEWYDCLENLYWAIAASPINISINVEKHSATHWARYWCISLVFVIVLSFYRSIDVSSETSYASSKKIATKEYQTKNARQNISFFFFLLVSMCLCFFCCFNADNYERQGHQAGKHIIGVAIRHSSDVRWCLVLYSCCSLLFYSSTMYRSR